MQLVTFLDDLRHAARLVGNAVVRHQAVLQPVAFLGVAEFFHEVLVVREVIEAVEGRDVVVALAEHALPAEGVVVQRTVDLVHPLLPRPGLGGAEQQARDLDVPDAVEPAETDAFLTVELVVAGVDHRADAPGHAPAVQYHPHLAGAVLQRRRLGQGVFLVVVQRRHILGTILVEFIRKTDELLQLLAGQDFLDFVIGHFESVIAVCKDSEKGIFLQIASSGIRC